MNYRDVILYRRELDDMGLTYLMEYLNRGLVLSKQLTKVISNKHGRLISWLPDDVKVPEPSYFDAGLISSRPPGTLSSWGGTWKAHELLLKNVLKLQENRCVVFEDVFLLSTEYQSNWPSEQDYLSLPSDYVGETYERWLSNAKLSSIVESIDTTSSLWHYLCAVGDNTGLPEFEGGALHTINTEISKTFAESVVFIAIEAWDGEGHVFWIEDSLYEQLDLPWEFVNQIWTAYDR